MSTLLVIDAQQPFLDRLGPDAPCWAGIADALARARAASWPVVHVHHHAPGDAFDLSGPGGQPVAAAAPRPGERIVVKAAPSALTAPDFAAALPASGDVYVCGGHVAGCVQATVNDLARQGRRVHLIDGALIAGDHRQADGTVVPNAAVLAHGLRMMAGAAEVVPATAIA